MGLLNLGVARKRLLSFSLIAFMVGGAIGGVLWHFGGVYTVYLGDRELPLQKFSSYEELRSFLNKSSYSYRYWEDGGVILPGITAFTMSPEGAKATSDLDYSATNIQVEGVDEADIVKTDGEYIYLVSGKNLFIVRAVPATEAKVLTRLGFAKDVTGLFVNEDRLIVFQGTSDRIGFLSTSDSYDSFSTIVNVYDIRDRLGPVLLSSLTLDGYYFTSRMIGDYVYIVVNKPAYLKNREVLLPVIRYGNRVVEIAAQSIYYFNTTDSYHVFTSIFVIDLNEAAEEPKHETFMLGATASTYVSLKNIYITSPKGSDMTNIHKFSIEGGSISYSSNGSIPGRVLNQFSMDENDGYFRVATTKGQTWSTSTPWDVYLSSRSNVYVLDTDLDLVGKLEGLALGETIHSARFMGDRCYLVTYQKTDPLFVVDLKDPANPKVLGKLKIPGYSDYLHPYDENHLIGVGKETVPAEEGDFSWYQGVKISLFDVTDVSAPREVAKVEIGDRGTDSPVLTDHRAFLFSREKNLLVLPILLAEVDQAKYPGGIPPNAYGEFVWQGAYVLGVSESGLTVRGRITHMGEMSGSYFDSAFSVKRSLYIGDVLYTISDRVMKMNSLGDLRQINALDL